MALDRRSKMATRPTHPISGQGVCCKDTTIKAFEILDVTNEPVKFDAAEIVITDDFLIGALSTFDQKDKNTQQELIVRTVLDAFFEDLSIALWDWAQVLRRGVRCGRPVRYFMTSEWPIRSMRQGGACSALRE